MKIAVNSWALGLKFRNQGTYVYARNLLAEFRQLSTPESEVEFCVFAGNDSNDAGRMEPRDGFRIARTRLLQRDRLWRLGGAGIAAAREQADLIFCPTGCMVPLGNVPFVCTIHDVTAITMPSHSRQVTWMIRSLLWWAARSSRAVITDSECSKQDLMEIYGLADSKISVVHLGYDKSVFNDDPCSEATGQALLRRLGIQRPYILHHGTIQPRKNLERLIAAYRQLISRNKNLELDLVLAGNRGWNSDGIFAAAERPEGGRVHFTGVLSDTDLATLVKGAALAVVPSLYEGFCLPMVECMACGTPTIASNTSCLAEISGGKLLYFDPLSVEDMSDGMERALENTQIRHRLSEGGKERAAEFDWRKCARETLDILKRHAKNGHN